MGKTVLDVLNEASHDMVLATEVGGVLVPIVKGVATQITQKSEGETITYTLAIKTGQQNLSDADAAFADVIARVNAERAKANLPPLKMPKTG